MMVEVRIFLSLNAMKKKIILIKKTNISNCAYFPFKWTFKG